MHAARPRRRAHRRERRTVRIVTLGTRATRHRPLPRVPIAVRAPVRAVQPVAVDRAVALRTDPLWLIVRNLPTPVIHESVPVGQVVAVEAARVDPVSQYDVPMLRQRARRLGGRVEQVVTLTATVGERRHPDLGAKRRATHRGDVGRPLRRNPHGRNGGPELPRACPQNAGQHEKRRRDRHRTDGPPHGGELT